LHYEIDIFGEPKVTVCIDSQPSGDNESHLSFGEGANDGRKAVEFHRGLF
jgi:hypothetical protein